MSKRMPKVNQMINTQLGEILSQEFEMPEGTMVTVTQVKVSSNLKFASVYVSIFPYNKKMQVLDFLKRKSSHISKLLGRKIKMKFTPKLDFIIDSTEEYAYKIDRLIDDSDLGEE